MAQQTEWKYSEKITVSHPITNKVECIENIHNLCKQEGAKNTPFNEEKCIDVDKAEEEFAKREGRDRRNSVDMAIGLKSGKKQKLMLCELKLNLKNPSGLKKDVTKCKFEQSKALLGIQTKYYHKPVYLVKKKQVDETINRLGRIYRGKRSSFSVYDLIGFKNAFFE